MKKRRYRKNQFGNFYQLSPGNVEKDIERFNKNNDYHSELNNSSGSISGEASGSVGESLVEAISINRINHLIDKYWDILVDLENR